jgi:hypothetical protein
MPHAPRPGKAGLYVELPEALNEALRERAAADRRSVTTTVIMALEAFLGTGPEGEVAERPKSKPKN